MQTLTLLCAIVSISFAIETEIRLNNLAKSKILKVYISDEKLQNLYESLNLGNKKSLELNINFIFDLVLEALESLEENTPPAVTDIFLPDFDVHFHNNYVMFEKGTISGFRNIKRDGDSLAGYSVETEKINILLPVKFSALQFKYEFYVRDPKSENCGLIQGNLTGFQINSGFSFDLNTKHFSVIQYVVTDNGKLCFAYNKNQAQDFVEILDKIAKTEIKPSIIKVVNKVLQVFFHAVIVLMNSGIDLYFNSQNQSTTCGMNCNTLDLDQIKTC